MALLEQHKTGVTADEATSEHRRPMLIDPFPHKLER